MEDSQEKARLMLKEQMNRYLDATIARDQREYEEKQWDNLRSQQDRIFMNKFTPEEALKIIEEINKKKKS